MKKCLALILTVVLTAAIIGGCGGSSTTPSSGSSAAPSSGSSAAPSTSSNTPIKIRCGITVSEDSNPAKALRIFEEKIEKESNGRLDFELYLNGTLGNERDMAEALTMGTQEMVALSTAPLINFSPDFMIWDLPYIVENNEEGMKKVYEVMDSEIGQSMLDSMLNQGIKGLAFAHNGFRYCINRKKDVATPADIKGLKIRTMENDVHLAFYNAVGANPTPMASTEAFTALQQGVIDGMDNNLDAFYTQGAWQSAKHLTLTGHVFSASAILISDKFFKSLSSEDQKIILDAVKVAKDAYREIAEAREQEVIEKFEKECGVKVTRVNIDDWKPLVSGIWDKYRDKINPKYFDALTK